MPEGAHRECSHPTCREYATHGGFCAAHNARTARPEFLSADRTVNPTGARFRRLRHSFLVRHPVCNMCKREESTILDHVIPHRGIALLFWNQRNWQGLCVHCHAVKTHREVLGHDA
jgi:5-methylcytosine-specific restriction protein A